MSRHCGIPTSPVELASRASSVEVKTWCTKTCHKYFTRCGFSSLLFLCEGVHSLTACLQFSLSSWLKVLYFSNTSGSIPILKPNTSARFVYFPHNLVFPNSSERTEIVLSLLTHCRPLARMHFSWFGGNANVSVEFVCILVYFQRHSRGCLIIVCFMFSAALWSLYQTPYYELLL